MILGIILTVIVVLGVSFVMFFSLNKSSTPISEIAFNEISITQNEGVVIIAGTLMSSGKSYRDFTYSIQDDTLMVTINSGIVSKKHMDGSFYIKIEDVRISNVQEIYLHDGKDTSLIYPK